MNILRGVQDLRHPHLRDIISGFQGVVRPGEMLRKLLQDALSRSR